MNFDFQFSPEVIAMYQELIKDMDGKTKAAILMIGLGTEASANVFKLLSDNDVELITAKIASLSSVEPRISEAVFEEFYEMIKAQEYISLGGIEYAKELLQSALGDVRAMEIIKKIQRMLQVKGFNVLKQVDSTQLLTFIQKEHPQTIALVLTQLEPLQAANVLTELPEDLRNDVVIRFAAMERVSQEMINTVEQILEERIDFSQQGSQFGGVRAAADIINLVGSTVERSILEAISAKDPKLATEIKNLMFVFEDILYLDDRTIQMILRDVDQKDLAMALKGVVEEVQEKIFKNISERGATIIKEEMEYAGPVRLREVETAQQAILDVIRKKEELGEIQLTKGGEDFVQ
ncbi:MAG TPA: flagellar motor switch protein FliG [Candidatus Cloacimonadota bacterium]|nr:flagellar motor switch protein FliG [Candidatus Cloacimonadota bacterium]HOQ80158.1 flagellar motor switch protein FliG [Candidatus Cloacimonadota bacterium]HPK41281.1 flagellar motor switch protein FliG [Candidatus Cloacimonadota bacterium]